MREQSAYSRDMRGFACARLLQRAVVYGGVATDAACYEFAV